MVVDWARVFASQVALFLAVEAASSFAQQIILFLPARLERPREDLLVTVAVVDGGVKEDPLFVKKCWALFDSG